MKRAGCKALQFGIESGSQRILRKMNKPFSIDQAELILRSSFSAGIQNFINLLIGFPGETEEDFMETLCFLERNRQFIQGFGSITPCYLTPSSLLEHKCKEYDISYTDSTDFSLSWVDKQNNNYETRKQRISRLKEHIDHLKIPLDDINTQFFLDEELKKFKCSPK